MNKNKSLYNLLIPVIIFITITVFSIIPRIKWITAEPLPYNIGHIYTITSVNAWNEKNPWHFCFVPVISHSNAGDKNMSEYKRIIDKEGNNYFISFPPLSFIVAWIITGIFSCFNINTVLVILALLSHIITGLLIFLTLKKLLPPKTDSFYISSILSAAIISFSPSLMFHSLSWFPGICILPLWAWFIYFLIYIKNCKIKNRTIYLLSFITSFLLCYSDWLGYFIIFSFLLYVIFSKKDFIFNKTAIYLSSGCLFALAVTLYQYSHIEGLQALFRGWALRFVERSGFFGNSLSDQSLGWFNPDTWNLFFTRFIQAFAGTGYLSVFLILLAFGFYRKKTSPDSNQRLIFFVTCVPALLHFILLLNSNSVHFGEWAKLSVPLALFAGISVNKIIMHTSASQKNYVITGLCAVTILAALVSSAHFNDFMSQYKKGEAQKNYAAFIKTNALPSEAVFIKPDSISDSFLPYIEFCSGRNIRIAGDTIVMKEKLMETGHSQGVLFYNNFKKQKVLSDRIKI